MMVTGVKKMDRQGLEEKYIDLKAFKIRVEQLVEEAVMIGHPEDAESVYRGIRELLAGIK
jgi:hypothetical protein